jgi:hypothetical protein
MPSLVIGRVAGTRMNSGSRPGAAEVKPDAEGADRIGGGMNSRGDTDYLAERLLVGLGASNGDEQAVAAEADVRQMEYGDLTWKERGGVSQQQNGSVADAACATARRTSTAPRALGRRPERGENPSQGRDAGAPGEASER